MFKKSCLNCKHHTFYYTANSIKCNHDLFWEFVVNDESELENIAGNCDEFEDNITAKHIYFMAINDNQICQLGVKIKREYDLENHTLTSIFLAFHLIAKLAVNYYAKEHRDNHWCQQTIDNQELMNQLVTRLKYYFLEVYQ
ncbi:hypothetical protein [Trichormus variabilis]|uniref:Uncharacterized protein n=1 Tax=Trichormus variabilis SAG 1403-4b TaxID=447716 RepID=A0A3S1A363_ANAVA|nr:hypothetical protein [Trichormus variabilis]MBD2629668.1 hypothetical protein [Trichormus variabilis FACHB-164]RUS92914.1 hypothetical protein DSM107003_46610 [Trichormus variabilis SAG 1403-4b]